MAKDFLDTIIDKFGEAVVIRKDSKIEPIPTGSLSLDISIGIGGIPRGKITEIYGAEGSGKTTLALSISKTVLDGGGKVLYIDVENMLDFSLIHNLLGEKLPEDRFVVLTSQKAEDVLAMAETAIGYGDFDLIVVDSVGALISKKELEVEMSKDTVAPIPKLISKFLRRVLFDVNTSRTALLMLNQVRDNFSSTTMFKSYETPGGHELKHLAAVRIFLSKKMDLKIGDEKIGISTSFIVKKNKLSAPFRSFTIPIMFGKGIDGIADIVDFASLLGVVKKSGSWYKYDGENLGQGKFASRDFLQENRETLDKIIAECYELATSPALTVTNAFADDEEEAVAEIFDE